MTLVGIVVVALSRLLSPSRHVLETHPPISQENTCRKYGLHAGFSPAKADLISTLVWNSVGDRPTPT